MELQLLENTPGFFGWEDFIQRCRLMRRQIIQNDPDHFDQRVQLIYQALHSAGKILHRMLLGKADMTFGLQRFEDHMQISHSMAPISD